MGDPCYCLPMSYPFSRYKVDYATLGLPDDVKQSLANTLQKYQQFQKSMATPGLKDAMDVEAEKSYTQLNDMIGTTTGQIINYPAIKRLVTDAVDILSDNLQARKDLLAGKDSPFKRVNVLLHKIQSEHQPHGEDCDMAITNLLELKTEFSDLLVKTTSYLSKEIKAASPARAANARF
jgi:hypothetical protein